MTITAQSTDPDSELIKLLQDSVADYCARALPPRRLRALRAAAMPFDRTAWQEMAELGWTGLVVPTERGGLGLSAAAVAAVCRELGRVVAAEPLIESAIAAGALLSALDPDDQRLTELLRGETIFTCPLSASAWQGVSPLTARAEGRGFVLNGVIDNLPHASAAELLLLPATCAGRLAMFRVPHEASGVQIQARTLADGSVNGQVTLVEVRCAAADHFAIGATAHAAITRALALTGIGGSAHLLGLCEALLEITLEYLRTRRQFGRALGTFQALQHRLVDLYLQVRLTAAALRTAVSAYEAGDLGSLALASVRVRQRACDTAMWVVREAIQMHGAIGYTQECDVALYVQRALVVAARHGGARAELNANPAFALGALEAADEELSAAPDHPLSGDWNALDDRAFRSLVRHWIEANYPAELRHFPGQIRWAEIREWHQRLLARGWAAPAWPVAYGGMGLAPSKMLIFIEELERWGVARAPDQGIVMLGPILFEYGSAEQRARFLEPALSGAQIWCQGYSEPNAGSDLASLTTSARLEGDEFIVDGQKTWTSHALDATHMYCLVRTDNHAKPQAGISFLLIDLAQPGVRVRPIINLGGHVDFCEVFLDNVRVPRANLVGQLNQGWTLAKSLLGHERLFVGSPKLCQHALHQLRELAGATGQTTDPVFMDALTRITLDVCDLEDLYAEFAARVKQGDELGVDVAILKIWSTETYVRLSEMIVLAAGAAGGTQGKLAFGDHTIDVLSHYYSARPAPIYAGSNEIQRNIIAKHVLQLPT